MSTTKTRPVHEIRLGRIRAAVWKTDTDTGPRFNVCFSRRYKDDQAQWKDATSFSRDDLPLLIKVADRAHSYLYENQGEPVGATDNPKESET